MISILAILTGGERVSLLTKAFIIVDVQFDFISGALAVPSAPQILDRLAAETFNHNLVIATQDWHPPNHSSFEMHGGQWPQHCVRGHFGAKLHPMIDKHADIVLRKGQDPNKEGYSGFEDTPLAVILGDETQVTVAGLAIDYCVAATAIEAANLGHPTTVLLTMSRGVDKEGSLAAIERMEAAGVTIIR